MGFRVAVVGANGMVGREILKTLAERSFPVDAMVGLGTGRMTGQEVSFGEEQVLTLRPVEGFDFARTQLAFFAAGTKTSAQHVARAAAAGCLVIDTSGEFRMQPDVPLVIPEINPQALARAAKRRIVASAAGAIVPVLLALKPLHDLARVRRVVVTSLEPVSATSRDAMDELWSQTRGVFVNETPPAEQFPKQIAFNLIPQVGDFLGDGCTREESAMAAEARKILDPDVALAASSLHVPVFIGHAATVHAEFERPIEEAEARAALREAAGLIVLDRREEGGYATPAETAGEDAVYVSRLRRDLSVPYGLAFWCVTDNLRKGSALNAVQVAEELLARGLLPA